MTKAVIFTSDKGDINAQMAFINNLGATTNPGTGDDIADGYTVGSQWVNVSTKVIWECVDATAGAAVWVVLSSDETAPGQVVAPDASSATGNGSAAALTGGRGGTTSGNGGSVNVSGGAARAGNGNGGSLVLTGGAKNGTGINGGVRVESLLSQVQGAPAAKIVSATLTAAELLSGIITVTQGAGAPSAQQLPNGAAIQAALPTDFAVGDSFDFSVINLGGASEVASITVNTDVTIVGLATINLAAATASGSGRFRCRKTADHVFVVYRIA